MCIVPLDIVQLNCAAPSDIYLRLRQSTTYYDIIIDTCSGIIMGVVQASVLARRSA